MWRFLKWVVGLIVVVVVIIVVGILMLPGDRMAKIAADQLSSALGRKVEITGDVTPSFYPVLGVKADGLRIAAPDWSPNDNFVRAEKFSVAVALAPLLQRDIQINSVILSDFTVILEKSKTGETSWDFGTGQTTDQPSQDGAAETKISFDTVSLTNGRILYRDHGTGQRFDATDADAVLTWDAAGQGLNADVSAVLNGAPARITAQLADLDGLLAGQATGVDATATIGKASIAFQGRADTTGQVKGTLNADVTDIASVMTAAGQSGPSLPAGLREALQIKGQLIVSPDKFALADATMVVGVNTFAGNVIVDVTGKPFVTGRLTTSTLNAAPFLQGEDGGSAGSGWSKDRIDLSGLAALNADVALVAQSVDLGDHKMGLTDVTLRLDRSRLVATLNKVQGFGGTVQGNLVANNRNGLSVGGDIKASNVNLRQMLGELADFDKLAATGNARIKFLGVGQSVDAIMKSLSGTGSLKTTGGELFGVDFVKYFADQGTGGGSTIFDGVSGTFEIQNGQLQNLDLSVLAPLFNALGQGTINLGDQSINYLLQPKVLTGIAKGLAIPVRISGPWSDLKIRPDLELLAKQKLAIEQEKLKAEAEAKLAAAKAQAEAKLAEEKAALEAKLQQEAAKALNVQTQQGQSVEDAVKDKVEDELKKGLLNLLGGN